MRYLVAVFPGEVPPENKCADGEPVIPGFPLGDSNNFIGVHSSGVSTYASARELPDVDPDEILKELVENYTGLPFEYLEDTLTQTLVAAASLDTTKIYRIFITPASAVLHNVEDDTEFVTIWKDRPASKYM